jgi:hypothetical protein
MGWSSWRETLDDLIRRLGRVEVKPALEITTQVAAGSLRLQNDAPDRPTAEGLGSL